MADRRVILTRDLTPGFTRASPMSRKSEQRKFSNGPPPLAAVLEQLACPVCLTSMRLEGSSLLCSGCGRIYPIVDGIPVLIADPAVL